MLSRGLKENSSLKCEVTPYLKKGNQILDGQKQSIQFKDKWSIEKQDFVYSHVQVPNPTQAVTTEQSDFLDELIELMTKTDLVSLYISGSQFSKNYIQLIIDRINNISADVAINTRAVFLESQITDENILNQVKSPVKRNITAENNEIITNALFDQVKNHRNYYPIYGVSDADIIGEQVQMLPEDRNGNIFAYGSILRVNAQLLNIDVPNELLRYTTSKGEGRIGDLLVDKNSLLLIDRSSINYNEYDMTIALVPF